MMSGCGNIGNSGFFCSPCIIILLIVILKNQCLLDTEHNSSARNALTLIFLFWLCCSCGSGGFGGFGGFGGNRGNFGSGYNNSFNSGCCCKKQCCCKCCC